MGKEIRRELKIIPAQAVIVEHINYVYACRNCETNACGVPIVKAPRDKPVIKGSFAAEAVAHIMTQKFANGLPLYRQEQEFNRMGISLSWRQTMSNWLIKCSEDWLEPLYEAMREVLCAREILHADETVLQVLHEPGKTPQSKSYMWIYRTSGDTGMPIVLCRC